MPTQMGGACPSTDFRANCCSRSTVIEDDRQQQEQQDARTVTPGKATCSWRLQRAKQADVASGDMKNEQKMGSRVCTRSAMQAQPRAGSLRRAPTKRSSSAAFAPPSSRRSMLSCSLYARLEMSRRQHTHTSVFATFEDWLAMHSICLDECVSASPSRALVLELC